MRRNRPNPEAIDERQYAMFVRDAERADTTGRLDRYPDLQPADLDEGFPYFDTAAENHAMWHEKDVEGAYLKDVHFPPTLRRIGYALEIVYLSDKWETHANFYSYVHHFDSQPEVYAAPQAGAGRGRARSTAKLLGVASVDDNARLAIPILARVSEFSFRMPDGSSRVLRFDFPPLMLCSPDKEGLIVLSEEMGPIVVRGGQMEINRRGIVK
jgi:hypothetical protein